jgi:hypothetical protein
VYVNDISIYYEPGYNNNWDQVGLLGNILSTFDVEYYRRVDWENA